MNDRFYIFERWGAQDVQGFATEDEARSEARLQTARKGRNMVLVKAVAYFTPTVEESAPDEAPPPEPPPPPPPPAPAPAPEPPAPLKRRDPDLDMPF